MHKESAILNKEKEQLFDEKWQDLKEAFSAYTDLLLASEADWNDICLHKKFKTELIKMLVIKVLYRTNANIVESAKILGMGRNTLNNYIKQFANEDYKMVLQQTRITQDKRRRVL